MTIHSGILSHAICHLCCGDTSRIPEFFRAICHLATHHDALVSTIGLFVKKVLRVIQKPRRQELTTTDKRRGMFRLRAMCKNMRLAAAAAAGSGFSLSIIHMQHRSIEAAAAAGPAKIFLCLDVDETVTGSPEALSLFNKVWCRFFQPNESVLVYNTARPLGPGDTGDGFVGTYVLRGPRRSLFRFTWQQRKCDFHSFSRHNKLTHIIPIQNSSRRVNILS